MRNPGSAFHVCYFIPELLSYFNYCKTPGRCSTYWPGRTKVTSR